jgi:cytoskeletal protein CcmA (bactofilin family)
METVSAGLAIGRTADLRCSAVRCAVAPLFSVNLWRWQGHAHVSVESPDLQINGCLTSTSDVLIEGSVDGDGVCRRLVIKSNGKLTGDAVAEEVVVSGSVIGRILAKTVGLTSRAVVVGDVNYCDLIVERQATLEATVQRISRECWDGGPVEQPSMISATPQTSA